MLGDGDVVDCGPVVASFVDHTETVVDFLELAVVPGHVLRLEHDIVVGLAPDGGDLGFELENIAGGWAGKCY